MNRNTGWKAWPRIFLLVASLAALLPAPVFAVQTHGDPEGLYVHQVAHVIFVAALVFLLYSLWKKPLGSGRGWLFFKWSLLFFLLWNVDAFTVHWLAARLPEEALEGVGSIWEHRLTGPLSLENWLYYFAKFDHLFSLPAIIFLVLSLRAFCRSAEQCRPAGSEP